MKRTRYTHAPSFKKKLIIATVTLACLYFIYQIFGPSDPQIHLVPVDLSAPGTCTEGTVQQLRWSPRAFLRKNILTEQERKAILEYGKTKIDVRAELPTANLTASRAVMIDTDTPELRKLQRKLSEWVMIPEMHSEKFILRRFKPGDFYNAHVDYLEDVSLLGEAGQRTTTVVYFLQNAKEGGTFEFPRVNYPVHSQTGDTLLFHNRLPNAQPDLMSFNMEHPTIEGEKWTLTKYFRERPIFNK